MSITIVLILIFVDPAGPVPALPVLKEATEAKTFLGLIWQVESGILGLLTAVILFAFEAMGRSRAEISVWEYAGRSWLSQYLMLGAAGVIDVGLVLMWTEGRPPLTAAHFAVTLSFSALVALPFVLYRAIKVVHPNWLREQRLSDVRRTVSELVAKDLLDHVAQIELREWAEHANLELGHRFGAQRVAAVEQASEAGYISDINLFRLERMARRGAEGLVLTTTLGERVSEGAVLVVARNSLSGHKALCVVTRHKDSRDLNTLLMQFQEEAMEAVRSESIIAIESVIETFEELWLAWPSLWIQYIQKDASGVLGSVNYERVGPLGDVSSGFKSAFDLAVGRGLHEHVAQMSSSLYRIGRKAIELPAPASLRGLADLARSLISRISTSNSPELQAQVNQRAWRMQVELCDYTAVPSSNDDMTPVEKKRGAIDSIDVLFRAMTETLKRLAEVGDYNEFVRLDKAFDSIEIEREPITRSILQGTVGRQVNTSDVGQQDPSLLELQLRLKGLGKSRLAYRLSVFAWMIAESQEEIGYRARELAIDRMDALGSVENVLAAVDAALSNDSLLSNWILWSLPEGEAHWIDSNGYILRAISVYLFRHTRIDSLYHYPWMNDHRIERLKHEWDILAEERPDWLVGLLAADEIIERIEHLKLLADKALKDQKAASDRRLIDQLFDSEKIERFKEAIYRTWASNRLIVDLADASAISITQSPVTEMGERRFGFSPLLEPKGLFVTPTDWGGLEMNGEDLGRQLGEAELAVIIQEVMRRAPKLAGRGDAAQRLRQALDVLRTEGLSPNIAFVPISWRLTRSLGLQEQQEEGLGSLKGRFKGYFEGVMVVAWHAIPKERIFVADLNAFASVTEGVSPDGTVVGVETDVDFIDADKAREIVSHWSDPTDGEDEEDRMTRVLASALVRIRRPYQVQVVLPVAARSIWLPESAR
ncbi:hypothetical protein GBF35_04275 [Nonomuraea phyllanthi]|uniref:hypothetical protein n=1 Tax=Nonomuraea phyllanthi TaxID=2219224 RepID=UPI00129353D0|nr:hypothetical protein [Nonomuraea phyllanthi]QFY05990.1 hypothetical protein GBF35_04275 [Nonomuraea phyllanthi]